MDKSSLDLEEKWLIIEEIESRIRVFESMHRNVLPTLDDKCEKERAPIYALLTRYRKIKRKLELDWFGETE